MLVLGVDVKLIIEVVAVCMLRDDGHEGEMLRCAGFTDPVDGPAGAGALALRAIQQIERDGHLRVRAGGTDDADDLALCAARNGVDGEVRDGGLRVCPGGDGGDGVVARGDLDGLLAPVLVGQIEGKGIAFAAGGGGDGERVAAGLLVLQEQRDRAGGGERLRAAGAGLVAFDGGNGDICGILALNRELIRQETIRQLVVVDGIGADRFAVFAGQATRCFHAFIQNAICHF